MDNVSKLAQEPPRSAQGAETGQAYAAARPAHVEPAKQRANEVSAENARARAEQAKEAAGEEPKPHATASGTYLRFSVDQKTHDVSVMVIDQTTHQIVRRVPPKNLSEFLQDRWQDGFSVDVWA
jgi:uncharacterized FlaG/YvyC family protein